jgi:hypothetical protein
VREKTSKGESQEWIRDEISPSRLSGEQGVERVRNPEGASLSHVGMWLGCEAPLSWKRCRETNLERWCVHVRRHQVLAPGVIQGRTDAVGDTLKESESL